MTEFKETIQRLFDSDITGYQIYKDTGISQNTTSEIRRGKRQVGNLTVDTAELLYNYQKQIETK